MNDFTKNELINIKEEYQQLLRIKPYSLEHQNFVGNLLNKLQFMIDSYCEHADGIFYEGDNPKQLCIKCRRPIK